jgi:HAD superfamily phosphatase (TIGR01668 family)
VGFILRLLRPNISVDAVWDIDLAMLRRKGIRGLILDLDNTLVDWNRWHVRPEVAAWMKAAAEQGMACCVASNTREPARLKAVAEQLGASWLLRAGKPLPKAYSRAMRLMGTAPAHTAVVGDQIFTDTVGGNLMGLTTIIVRPLSSRDFPGTKLARMAEKALRPWLFPRNRRAAAGVTRRKG